MMNKNRKYHISLRFLVFLLSALFTGCGKSNISNANGDVTYQIYYLNKDETKVVQESYDTVIGTTEEKIEELLEQLGQLPKEVNEKPAIGGKVEVKSYTYHNRMLTLDFAPGYLDLEPITEVLTRAAIVRTLVQIEDVNYIVFRVNGEMLADKAGSPVGTMTATTFVDNAGAEINSYETVKLTLFFANEAGTELITTYRTVDFNTNISLERLVVEQIIAGPNIAEAYPVVNAGTKVINVTTIDGVCYVNLDSTFLTKTTTVNPEVVIYAITNSLVELSDINKVQIMVDGETDFYFKDVISLKTIFERNLDIVE